MFTQNDSSLDWARPHTAKLRGVALVREERGLWVTGCMVADKEVRFELSFELCHELKCLPGTFVTFLGMWYGKKSFEFCMGQIVGKPDPTVYAKYVTPLLKALDDYYPMTDNRARFEAMRRDQLAQTGAR